MGRDFDVGLVGWWFASNYGSALTYYGLGKILTDMDQRPIMIDIPKLNNTPWENETKKTVDFIKGHFPITKHRTFDRIGECNDLCDTFMLGSDQLWTKLAIDLLGYTFFLDFADESKKKIAYATSFGHAKFDGTPEENEFASACLNCFDYISVRENSGVSACKEYFNIDVKRDLDPVFVCDKRHYDALADNSGFSETEDYLLCYILDPTEEIQKAIKETAERLNLRVIAILDMKTGARRRNEWHTGELKEDISIEGFVYYIRHCKFLITDSHHGICFGIIYNKDFIGIANYTRGLTRFTNLLELMCLTERLVYSPEEIAAKPELLSAIDYTRTNQILVNEKTESLRRLETVIKTNSLVEGSPDNAQRTDARRTLASISQLRTNPDFVKIRILATLLRDYGIKHIVLSPGGRDVPIVRMFEYNKDQFILHSVVDERSAAYYGLGIAAQLRRPVACVCTSGTAASNYLPAVTEAYFTGVPLIVITADRYQVYHGQGEDQTIPQDHIFDGVIKKSVTLNESAGSSAEYQARRDISDCILETTHNVPGPVHINIAINNISMGEKVPHGYWKLLPRINQHILRVSSDDEEAEIMKWVNATKHSERILLVYGQNPPPTDIQKKRIEQFASKFNCVIVTDHISNLDCMYSLAPFNMLQAVSQQEFNDTLAPDIMITVGGKRLMNDPLTAKIRSGPRNIRHWSVMPDGKIKDFYFRLTSVLEMSQDFFFRWFSEKAGDIRNNGVYFDRWKRLADAHAAPQANKFNAHYVQSRFVPAIPSNSILHLGVGQSFFFSRRYHLDPSVEVFCNMGTNGIDGCTSTFMGQCAVVKDRLCFLLIGDLSFFYDMNSLWNKRLDNNVRILLVNNKGTDLLRGNNLSHVTAAHNTTAKAWVESVGFEYISAQSKEEFDVKLNYFISTEPQQPLFFEVIY